MTQPDTPREIFHFEDESRINRMTLTYMGEGQYLVTLRHGPTATTLRLDKLQMENLHVALEGEVMLNPDFWSEDY